MLFLPLILLFQRIPKDNVHMLFMLKISDNLLYLQIALYSKNKFTVFLQHPVQKCFDIMYILSSSPSLSFFSFFPLTS